MSRASASRGASNAGPKKPNPGVKNLIPFKKTSANGGVRDPRINVTGAQAKSQRDLKNAIQAYLNEPEPGAKETRLQELLSLLMYSKSALDRKTLMEYGFGKLPQPIQARFEGGITVHFVDETEGDDDDGTADGSSDPSAQTDA